MEFADWRPYYKEIVREFEFEMRWDEIAAALLMEQLARKETVSCTMLEKAIKGRDILVIADSDVELDKRHIKGGIRIAADGATSKFRQWGVVPEVIVTDLDGDVQDQVDANFSGSICLIHAHGDNIDALRRWVPRFSMKVCGTTQAKPFDRIYNFGGFTDGDRAALLAKHFGAKTITLVGFDFENPKIKEGKDPEVKLRKLAWAKRLIMENIPEAKWLP